MTNEETPVLVVDENRKVTALLEVLLDRIGVHDRVVVHDGYEAVRALEERRFAAALVDTATGPLDPVTLAREGTARHGNAACRLLLMTMTPDPDRLRPMLDAGYHCALLKPFPPAALRARLEGVVRFGRPLMSAIPFLRKPHTRIEPTVVSTPPQEAFMI
ncbi:response regulator [Salinarimonas ramus]|uniref:Response regulatory domain-containing protein n=1 Tax=Salinarimonas ramus TaxID=690164 RepID=A0A917Q5B3_9HYPH|nr:response regulator [Salinarimonas ramus]GGK28406.1 hypothetical protein GCM10011322_13580 [Salinarimonas ramus]